MSVAVELLVNPGDTDQRYIVWSNGWLQPVGGALPIAQAEYNYSMPDPTTAPTFYQWDLNADGPVAAAQIISWTGTPSGYTLDSYGKVYAWGGASYPSSPLLPIKIFEFPTFGYYSDFVMNPAGNGQGYGLNYDGDVIVMGSGTGAVPHSAFLAGSGCIAIRLYMDWASKRYWVLDSLGRWWGFNGGNNLAVGGLPALAVLPGVQNMTYAGALYDLTAAAKGWHMNEYGQVDAIGGAIDTGGDPSGLQYKIWTDIRILSQSNPIRLALLHRYGGIYEYNMSTAPTVTVQAPADPTTTTSRPRVQWSVADAEGDAVASWDVVVFTDAQYGIGGFDPNTSPNTWRQTGSDALTRGVQVADLANDTYRAYVRVTDTSGLTSSWAYKQWVQNLTRPATPTVTPTVSGNNVSLALHVNPSGLPSNSKFGVQYHDADWDGSTWNFVANGWDLTPDGSGNYTLIDYGAGFGVQRTYRTIVYVYDAQTDTWNGSDWSSTATATITTRKWILSTADASDGVDVKIEPGFNITRPVRAGVFWPSGRKNPIVVSDGAPKGVQTELGFWALDNSTRTTLETLFNKTVLLLRDPFGHRWYLVQVGDMTQEPLHAAPLITESTPTRDANKFKIKVQEVDRPKTGPTAGPLAV